MTEFRELKRKFKALSINDVFEPKKKKKIIIDPIKKIIDMECSH